MYFSENGPEGMVYNTIPLLMCEKDEKIPLPVAY